MILRLRCSRLARWAIFFGPIWGGSGFFEVLAEVNYLLRSPYALLKGDAYTAEAADYTLLFYNPAALSRGELFKVSALNLGIGASNPLKDLDRFDDFPDTAEEITERFLGFPIYAHLGLMPFLKLGPFGFSYIAHSQASLVLQNATYPQLDLNYRYYRGFVFGYAYDWISGIEGSFQEKKKKGLHLSTAVSVKKLDIEVIDETFDIFSVDLYNRFNKNFSDPSEIRNILGSSRGSGWGFDAAMELGWLGEGTSLIGALSLLDIGDTKFVRASGTSTIPDQSAIAALGFHFKQDLGFFDYSINFDLHPLFSKLPFGRKTHFGFDFGLPFARGLLGLNGGHLSYGVEVNIYFFKLLAGLYDIEMGVHKGDQKSKRAVLYLSLLDFSIDA